MTAHGSDGIASRFPESLSEAKISEINEKAIPVNKKEVTDDLCCSLIGYALSSCFTAEINCHCGCNKIFNSM